MLLTYKAKDMPKHKKKRTKRVIKTKTRVGLASPKTGLASGKTGIRKTKYKVKKSGATKTKIKLKYAKKSTGLKGRKKVQPTYRSRTKKRKKK